MVKQLIYVACETPQAVAALNEVLEGSRGMIPDYSKPGKTCSPQSKPNRRTS